MTNTTATMIRKIAPKTEPTMAAVFELEGLGTSLGVVLGEI